ncbi:uncharacterized protein LOC115440506 [Manduca sexta]|uniref:uncharacterized protein LOC115440506 n=1 Tax=Manduca sexta TaxID=7130 RepID=UPI0011841F53|nr:uncharacterized protein LOC115440506 [Manduca sexta]
MQKTLCLVLSLSICYLAESAPPSLGSLEFDKLDTDLSDLRYEVEEEDLDDFSKILDEADVIGKKAEKATKEAKTSLKTSGFKKKNATNVGLKGKYDIGDLKKFFNIAGVDDKGAYDDDKIYALAQAGFGEAVGIKGDEQRKYRKGTKTRGFHKVHHKDEYEKDKLFYEDDETKGSIDKVGAKATGVKLAAGAGFNKGHFHHDRQKGIYGKQGYLDKGFLDKQFNGFSDAQGFDGEFKTDS